MMVFPPLFLVSQHLLLCLSTSLAHSAEKAYLKLNQLRLFVAILSFCSKVNELAFQAGLQLIDARISALESVTAHIQLGGAMCACAERDGKVLFVRRRCAPGTAPLILDKGTAIW